MVTTKVFLFGIDNAGKTSISKMLKAEADMKTEPTITFDISRLVVKNLEFAVWDAPGQKKERKTWKDGYSKAQVLLFIIDTSDETRYVEAKEELDKVLASYDVARVPLIICFNKMDLPRAKQNIEKAKASFDKTRIPGRKTYAFETTTHEAKTFNPVRDQLVEVIKATRWSSS